MQPSRASSSWLPQKSDRLLLAVGVGGAYLVTGRLGLALALVHPSATVVWPPTGVALAAMILFGRWLWPVVFAAAFLVNVTTAGSLLASLGIATGNTLEAVVGSYLAERFAGGKAAFERPAGVFAFAVTAGLAGPSLSATIGVSSLGLSGLASWDRFPDVWLAWWAGDVGSALVLAPFLIVWARSPLPPDHTDAVETVLVLAATIGVALIVFTGLMPFAFIGLVPVLWASLRLHLRATATSTLLLAFVGVGATLRGRGPFARPDIDEPMLPLMAYLVVLSVGALAVASLMNERRLAEQELRRLASIVASSQDAIVGAGPDGLVTSWNAGAERLYGYSAGEMLGRPIRLAGGPEGTRRILDQLAQGAEQQAVETEHARKDGSPAHVSLSVSAVRDGEGRIVGYASIARDVGDRRRLEELRQYAAQLGEENRRMQEVARQKSRFVSHVSHELRTPLTSIVGFTDVLGRGTAGPLSEMQQRCVSQIEQGCQLLLSLVDGVLDLARLDAGRIDVERETVDVCQLASEVTHALSPLSAEKAIQVSARIDPALGAVLADRDKLRQLLFNYLSNALKFTPVGGAVEVRGELEGPHWWRLDVEDNGTGVPAEVAGRLFRDFERFGPSPTEQGLGLGLAIARRIVEAQGGSVGYRPAVPAGSVFFARLPRVLRGGEAA